MTTRTTKVTHKGQITIPIDLRNALGFQEGDTFIVERDENRIVFQRATDVARRTAGVFAKYALAVPLTPAEEGEAVEQAVAEEYIDSLARQ